MCNRRWMRPPLQVTPERRINNCSKSVALFLVASVFAFAADKVEVKGMNNGRSGDTLLVKTATGNVTVVLTDATVTKDNIGLFGLDRAFTADTVLIPGLKVDVNGASDEQGRVVAKTITVDGDDLESSQMIEAGLQPTADQVAANIQVLEEQEKALGKHTEQIDAALNEISEHKQQINENIKDIEDHEPRFAQLTEYDVKGESCFTGSAARLAARWRRFGIGSWNSARNGPRWAGKRYLTPCARKFLQRRNVGLVLISGA